MKTDWVWWAKWGGTVLALIGAAFNSFEIWPWNVWLCFLGAVGWAAAGWAWREWSLISINVILCVIYGAGIVRSFL